MELVSLKVTVFTINSKVLSILKAKNFGAHFQIGFINRTQYQPHQNILVYNSRQKLYYLYMSTDISVGGTIETFILIKSKQPAATFRPSSLLL